MEILLDNDSIQIQETIVKDTLDINDDNNKKTMLSRLRLNDQSTPKSVKKLLNDHGLCDMTNSPTVIELNNKEFKKNKSGDKFDHLLDNIFSTKNISSEKEKSMDEQKNKDDNDDSLDFSLDFKKEQVPQTDLRKAKRSDEPVSSSSNCKKRLRQITMTQAFDNYRTSQLKENLVTTTLSSSKIPIKSNEKVLSENRDILKKKNIENNDDDDDLFVIEANNQNIKQLNLARQKTEKLNYNFDVDNNTNEEDEDNDDLIFNFDKPPKKKTNSPNYKYVQIIRNQNDRKKLTANSCRDCEQVKLICLT